MTGPAAKQISSPFSTGGGGVNFEFQVQASFVALMLAGGFAPCLPCRPIQKIKLQGRYAGYDIDDLIVFTANAKGSDERKLLGQIKHSISITERDTVFGEVIAAARYGIELLPASAEGHDAKAPDGTLVQIKATQARSVALRSEPEHLIVLFIERTGNTREVYNGPGRNVWEQCGKMQKNGQRPISVSKLNALNKAVAPSNRLASIEV